MRTRCFRRASLIWAGCLLVGCADASPSVVASSSSRSSESAVTPASASALPLGSGAKPFCDAVCKRSAACGLEKVEQLTKSGEPGDKAMLEEARRSRPAVESSCIADCQQGSPSAAELEQARMAAACTREASCEAFASCLRGVAAQK